MKPAKILLALICVCAAGAASAKEIKVAPAKMTCADFVQVDEAYQPALVYWVAGVDKLGVKETETTVIDTAQPVGATVAEACKLDPKTKFMSKVRSMVKANQIALFDHH
ncbi:MULTISPECIES: HdeA/HdeB family chaperone [Caballeronia]|jgi:acid stress chaperone HdeA|uniref:HdeA/HdeB family chaperone n=1 Tax=Caballeronia jiangsuensis TaxID=1458357 RepID=A0ABW9CIT8_9BURK|nr:MULTISPECIES: HdeA/HdeB family chaperone [Caballeronia]MBC8639667.1 HdeA family protein [Caballeronia sp. EK]GJH13504.1 HdeA family protein [Caballeronia novacaledonica]